MRKRYSQEAMPRSPVPPPGVSRAVLDRPARGTIALGVLAVLARSVPVPPTPAPLAVLARRAGGLLGGLAMVVLLPGPLAVAGLPGAADAPTGVPGWERHAALLDGSRDQLVRSARVPDAEQPQGEVRLLRRGAAVVMQTMVQSTVLRRVVAEIRSKELAAWPEGKAGAADSRRYVEALAEAARERGQRHPPPAGGNDGGSGRRRGLLIEFILADRAALVAFCEPQIAEGEPRFRLTGRRPLALLELSPAYVRGNLFEIAVDALKLSREEAAGVLGPLLPPEPPAGKSPAEGS